MSETKSVLFPAQCLTQRLVHRRHSVNICCMNKWRKQQAKKECCPRFAEISCPALGTQLEEGWQVAAKHQASGGHNGLPTATHVSRQFIFLLAALSGEIEWLWQKEKKEQKQKRVRVKAKGRERDMKDVKRKQDRARKGRSKEKKRERREGRKEWWEQSRTEGWEGRKEGEKEKICPNHTVTLNNSNIPIINKIALPGPRALPWNSIVRWTICHWGINSSCKLTKWSAVRCNLRELRSTTHHAPVTRPRSGFFLSFQKVLLFAIQCDIMWDTIYRDQVMCSRHSEACVASRFQFEFRLCHFFHLCDGGPVIQLLWTSASSSAILEQKPILCKIIVKIQWNNSMEQMPPA